MAKNKNEMRETLPYLCWERYHNTFYNRSNVHEMMQESRNFVSGHQYESDEINDLPKPVFNICREEVEKTVAKLLEVQPAVEFVADVDAENLTKLDNFYEYQLAEIDDEDIRSRVCRTGMIDGVAVVTTSFDEDTLGVESLFKGFLKREIIPFERTFYENPYCNDIQDQQYWGYHFRMSVNAVKHLVEGKSKEEIDELILPEDYYDAQTKYSTQNIDNQTVNVYVRFFRLDGEVFFEMATRWCDIYEHPHALNPKINEKLIKMKKKDFLAKLDDVDIEEYKQIVDYDLDDPKYTLFTKAVRFSNKEYKKAKSKFYRYPVSVFRPYPIEGSILGESAVSLIIANQKIINYTFLLIILIMQSHAMPKILAKPSALKGQEYDNSPNQILTDYTPITEYNGWGITRLSSGDAVNSNLIEIGSSIIKLTRNINGFDDLVSNITNDTSGYAYQQVVKQANLTLQEPQKKFWKYVKDIARTDILYFKHYINKAKYYVKQSDSKVSLDNRYKEMSEQLNAKMGKNKKLPDVRKIQVLDIDSQMFDSEFNVTIEVEAGIAGSQISESQHYQQVFQYIASGNLDADKIRVMIENDPAFSSKTRQRIMHSLEALEISQLQIKNQEIAELRGMIENLVANLQTANQNLEILKMRDKAKEEALKENIEMNQKFFESFAPKNTMTESEVKSNNAKGRSGGSFSKGGSETVANTSK